MGTSIPRIELPENRLAEDYREYLSDPSVPEEKSRELKERAEALTVEKQRSFLDRISPILEERLKVLEQKQIDINLLSRAREVQEYINQLLKKLEARVKSITPPAPQATEETFPQMSTIAEKLQKEWEKHPVRTTLTGAALVLGVLTVGSWIANRFRKAREAGKQAMQTGGSWLKRILIATGVSLGVFLGLKVYKEYKELKGLLQLRKPEKPEVPELSVVEPPESVEVTPDQVEVTEELIERQSLKLTGDGLVFMNKKRREEAGIEEEVEKKAVGIVLNMDEVRRLKVKDLLRPSISNSDDAQTLIPVELSPARKKALFFIVLCCRDLEPRVRESLWMRKDEWGNPIDLNEMSLEDFLGETKQVTRVFQRLGAALKGRSFKDVDVREVMAAAFSRDSVDDIVRDSFVQAELKALGINTKKEREALALYCVQFGDTIALNDVYVDSTLTPDVQAVQKAVVEIRKTLQDEKTKKYLQLYLHGQTMRGSVDFREVIRNPIDEELNVLDALQLYAYLRKAEESGPLPDNLKNSNPMGSFLLQMKVLDLVSHQDEKMGKHLRDFLLLRVADTNTELDLPDGTKEFLKRAASTAGHAVVDASVAWAEDQWGEFCIMMDELQRKYPKPMTAARWGIPSAAVLGTSYLGYKWWATDWTTRMGNRFMEAVRKDKKIWFRARRPIAEAAWNPANANTISVNLESMEKDVVEALGNASHERQFLKAYRGLHRRSYHPQSFARFYEDLDALRKAGASTRAIDEAVRRAKVLERDARVLQYRRFRYIRRMWKGAGRLPRGVGAGSLALHGYFLYQDALAIAEAWEQEELMEKHTDAVMADIRSRLEESGSFEAVPGKRNVYRHKGSDVEISLREVKKQLRTAHEALDDRTWDEYRNAAVDAASILATVYWGAKIFSGPVGIATAVDVEVTVRSAVNAWNQGNIREFIRDCPPWLLATLGTRGTTGTSEYDLLAKASSWMISDVFPSLDDADKPELRRKMLFTIFSTDLGRFAPEFFSELTRSYDAPPLLDELYKEDFQKIVLPFFSIRLFQIYEQQTSLSNPEKERIWERFREGKIDQGSLIFPQDVTFVQVRRAMRDGATLYLQHLRESRYLAGVTMLKKQERGDSADPVLAAIVEEMGEQQLFGQELSKMLGKDVSEITLKDLESYKQTRAQKVITALQSRIATSLSSSEKENLFLVPSGTVAGVSSDLDFSKRSTVLDLIDDPVVRERLSKVFPETTEEREGRIIPSVLDDWKNKEAWKKWLPSRITGVDEHHSVLMARHAADNVLSEAKVDKLPDSASFEAAEYAITAAAVQVFEKREESPSYRRNDQLAEDLYGDTYKGPLVYSKFSYRFNVTSDYPSLMRLCKKLANPDVTDAAFSLNNVRAVYFGGKTMESGHQVVLATFLYGDLRNEVQVLQQAAATSATANSQAEVRGMARAASGVEFAQQEGGASMVELARSGLEQLEKERTLARQKAEQEQRQREQQQKTTWEKSKPERDQEEKEQNDLREDALEKAKRGGSAMTYIPGRYERDEQKQIFRVERGEYRSQIEGWDVVQADPYISLGPSVGSAEQKRTKGTLYPSESEMLRFSATKTGKTLNYKVSLQSLIGPPRNGMTQESQRVIQEVFTRPLDLTGHSEAQNERYVEEVRRYELQRVLNNAIYKESFRWYPEDYRRNLFQNLWPLYARLSNNESRHRFLDALLSSLVEEKSVNSGSYGRIIKRMQDLNKSEQLG
jgi:hypothetical protein